MRILTIGAVLLVAAGALSAQAGAGWVVLQGGSVVSISGDVFEGGPVFGVGAGGWFTDHWGAEVAILSSQVEVKATDEKGQEVQGLASGLFNFNPGGTFAPFLRLGLGLIARQGDLKENRSDRRGSFHGGLGVQGRFGEHLLGVVEFRETRVGRRDPTYNESAVLLGVGYRWGGHSSKGMGVPASEAPSLISQPQVEALPPNPSVSGAEEVPQQPQAPGSMLLPTPQNPPPPVVLLP